MPEAVYEEIPVLTMTEVEEALRKGNPCELLYVPLSAALYLEDSGFAERMCCDLTAHSHFNVRANAFLGLAHIARIHGELEQKTVKPLILRGLADLHVFVRGHASDAKEDLEHYLGWEF